MKEEKKNSNQQLYRVRLYKDFDFPSFSVSRDNRLEDMAYGALEEMKENYKNTGYFNLELINVLPFSLKTEVTETTNNTNYDFLIREISLENTKEKYGSLEYKDNPKNFSVVSKSDTSVTLCLLPEIEDYFIKQIKKYTNLVKTRTVNI